MEQVNEVILGKVENIFELAKDIKKEDEYIGEIFLMNMMNSMEIINSRVKKDTLDLSDKIETISNFLGFDLEEVVKAIVEKNYISSQGGGFVKCEETEKEVVDFIINNTKNIDDYEKFLQENSVKENLSYLKEVL